MKRRTVSFLLVAALAGVPPAAEARTVCGPSGAKTLSESAQARVFVRSRSVRSCHAARKGSYRLGARARIIDAQVAGRYALVRGRTRDGQSLRVVDLRRLRRFGDVRRFKRFGKRTLDPMGLAAFHALLANGEGIVGTTHGGAYRSEPTIDALGLAGGILAYRVGEYVDAIDFSQSVARLAGPGELMRIGDVRLDVKGGVTARKGSGPRVELGTPGTFECTGRSNCGGWGRIRIVGDRVLQPVTDVGIRTWLNVFDLTSGASTTPCTAMSSSLVTTTGKIACMQRDVSLQLIFEGRVLDSGPGIDPQFLEERDGLLVWRHDGVERSTPIPSQ